MNDMVKRLRDWAAFYSNAKDGEAMKYHCNLIANHLESLQAENERLKDETETLHKKFSQYHFNFLALQSKLDKVKTYCEEMEKLYLKPDYKEILELLK